MYFFFLVALSTTTNKALYKTENLFQIDNINITGIPSDNIEGLNGELYKTIEKNIFFLKKEVRNYLYVGVICVIIDFILYEF